MRRLLKWICGIILTVVLLFVLLAVLIYVPPVQNWIVKHVAAYASEQTGMDISVDHVKLVFPLDLGVEGVRVIQQNDSLPGVKDTIADIKSIVVNVQLLPLLKSQVEIDALDLNGVKVNTADFIHEARIKGTLGRLYVASHGIDLSKETVMLDEALLKDAMVNVELSDTVPPDTTTSENLWKIAVKKLDIENTGVTIHMPGDTLQVAAYMEKTAVRDGYFDLDKGLYTVQKLDLTGGTVNYDNNFEATVDGLDYNHIALTDLTLGVDSVSYCDPALGVVLRACSFKEKSGLEVERLTGNISMDSIKLSLPNLDFRTSNSFLTANIDMDLDAFDEENPGKLQLTANGAFGKQDIMLFLGGMPTSFIRKYPNQQLEVKTVLTGNLKYLNFAGLNIKLPSAFNINASGYAANIMDENNLSAEVKLDAKTYDIGFVTALFDTGGVAIPYGLGLNGKVNVNGQHYIADLTATAGTGNVKAKADFNAATMAYDATVSANNLQLGKILVGSGMGDLTATAKVKGRGIDLMSTKTAIAAAAKVDEFSYGDYNLDSIGFYAAIGEGKIRAGVNSRNPLFDGSVNVDGYVKDKDLKTTITADMRDLDLYGLKIMDVPFNISLCSHIDLDTDLKNFVKVDGAIGDLSISDSAQVFRPDELTFDAFASNDTTHFAMACGDFNIRFSGSGGYDKIIEKGSAFADGLLAQLNEKKLDITTLRTELPVAEFALETGDENPLGRFISTMGFSFDAASIDLKSSPYDGINGDVHLYELQYGSFQLDTVRFSIVSDSVQCTYNAQVRNNKDNKQYVFNALLDGYIFEKGSGINIRFYDSEDSLGVKLGLEASMEEDGMKLRVLDDPILGYKQFTVNEGNYVYMGSDKRIYADLMVRDENEMGVYIYSDNDNRNALQDLTVSLNQFDLEQILSSIPYMPNITGILDGDFHVILTEDELSLASSISVEKMTYEGSELGDLGMEFVYIPEADGTHSVDLMLSCNGDEVADVSGTYKSTDSGDEIAVEMDMNQFPLRMVNGFMPEGMVYFFGTADGQLDVKGSLSSPVVNGELALDSCIIYSPEYGVKLRVGDAPIRIVGSNLLLENFKMYASNDNALALNGNVDFSDFDNMTINLNLSANNFQLIDAKENRMSVAYGKAFIDAAATVSGNVDNLKMSGRVDVLGTTNLSYILKDSPLTTDNQMDELVRFVNFKDSTETLVTHQPIGGITIDLTLNVEQGTRIMCYLNADKSNYIDLMGGGNLRMEYDAANDIRLTGKYTLDDGEMKYSLPIIPLKTFTIQDGSYVEFTGDVMNPRLNITATETMKANVSSGTGDDRTVEFECGVIISKTLSDMGLEFTLDAPEDMSLHSELMEMGTEQRGKLAVTMLTTGMYLADGNTAGFSMNSALSSFLESEINNITGNALRSLDLSIGLDNTTDGSGNSHTDYSFKFSKRLWNNRLKIVVGGKVSTGAEVENQNESFFDNVTFEYRLGSTSDKYLKLFYDNNAYDWLEGTTREYGVGFIWRRSLQHFKDIFKFKTTSDTVIPMDTTETK
ncbi:MAG: translocation/assembly module TamB [Prevotella sp.]|nr:translocation/assembly module TamB [Prevotella sp.]